jgi:hypothetical protein
MEVGTLSYKAKKVALMLGSHRPALWLSFPLLR